ncbi:MAG: hypothetical protein Kow0077_18840 [Anaerolineae bacterium]
MVEEYQYNEQQSRSKGTRPALIVIVTAVIFFALGYGAAWFAFNSTFGSQDELAQVVQNAVNEAFSEFELAQGQADTAAAQQPEPTAAPVEVSLDDDPAWGPEDAPVVIVEFSDFRCGFCGRFFAQTLPTLKEQYAGQIRFVYRDFPVVGGEQAALAAQCVFEQSEDLFWQYHDILFQNQSSTGERDVLVDLASGLDDIDLDAFQTCLDEERYASEIAADFNDGLSYGVRGTPAFFINGRAVVGAQPLAVFQQVIDEALAEAGAEAG